MLPEEKVAGRERFYLMADGKDVSPWHDIPLRPWGNSEKDVF